MAGGPPRGEGGERALFAAPAEALRFLPAPPAPGAPQPAPAGETVPSAPPPGVQPPASRPARTWLAPSLPSRAAVRRAVAVAVATEIDRRTPFILAPACLACGAFAYFGLAAEPSLLSLVAAGLVLLPLVLATRSRPAAHFALAAMLLVVVGMTAGKVESWRAATKMLGGEISTELTGRVVALERQANGRVRLTIDVLSTARPVLRYAPDRVRVSARKAPDGTGPGSLVSGLVRLLPPSGPVRPGSYDFSFESYFDGIGASGYFLRGPDPVAAATTPSLKARFQAAVERARDGIAARIRGRIGGTEGEIAAALVVGIRAGIPEQVNDDLRRAGIYHVISISGLHMALVAGTIMGLLRIGFALFPDFASRRPVKKLSAALAIGGLAAYLFISGGEVAAQRSFIMLAVMLTAVLFDRAALTMRNLAISAFVVILVSPHEVTGPSFQMSFAATAALVGAYAAWSDYRALRPSARAAGRTLPGRLARSGFAAMLGLAATSLVAGGATAVYSAYHFQQMPSLGLFTNLAAMPVVSVMVMPFAVFGTLAMPFGLDGPFFAVMGQGLTITLAIAQWFAERSPIDIVGLIAPGAVVMATLALLIATTATTWLRAAALPFALAALILLKAVPRPDLFVSEDGRLAGLDRRGSLAVSRARPNAFTVENWQRALRTNDVVGPAGDGATAGFVCDAAGVCVARHGSGAVVVQVPDAAAAERHCAEAAVIIVGDASARGVCRHSGAMVITARELARFGSAEVRFSGRTDGEVAGAPPATVAYAIRRPYRPWHEQRRFSRAARGMAPYRSEVASRGDAERKDGNRNGDAQETASATPLPGAGQPRPGDAAGPDVDDPDPGGVMGAAGGMIGAPADTDEAAESAQ